MKPKNKYTIAVMSYEIWNHPRALKIARSLSKNGYKVKLWGSRKPFKRGPRIFRALLNYILSIFEVISISADIYWIENIPDISYILLPLLRKKYVYDRRSPWSKQLLLEFNRKIPKITIKIVEAIERFLIKHSLYITVVSSAMKHEYKYNKPVSVIPNYPEESFRRRQIRNIKKELGIDEDKKVFIFIGRLSVIEGADLLPFIVEKLEGLNAELWILGDGPERNTIKKLQEKNHVRWFGWVKREDVPHYIASADYGIVPRHENPFSIFYSHEGVHKISEYLAFKKPVIASGIAPSPYYLVVRSREIADAIAKIVLGELKLPIPPSEIISWEKNSEHKIIEIIKQLNYKLEVLNK